MDLSLVLEVNGYVVLHIEYRFTGHWQVQRGCPGVSRYQEGSVETVSRHLGTVDASTRNTDMEKTSVDL